MEERFDGMKEDELMSSNARGRRISLKRGKGNRWMSISY